jgi:hypothetical protein
VLSISLPGYARPDFSFGKCHPDGIANANLIAISQHRPIGGIGNAKTTLQYRFRVKMGKVRLLMLQAHCKRFDADGNGSAQPHIQDMLSFDQAGNIGADGGQALIKFAYTPVSLLGIAPPGAGEPFTQAPKMRKLVINPFPRMYQAACKHIRILHAAFNTVPQRTLHAAV